MKTRAALLCLSLSLVWTAPVFAQADGTANGTAPSTVAAEVPDAAGDPSMDPEFAAALAEAESADVEKTSTADATEMFGALVQMVLVLAVVCALAYLLLGKVLPKLMRVQTPTAPHRMLEVVDRLPLDPRRSIMVIKLGERFFLVGATEQGINLLSRLETEEVEDALASAAARRDSTSLSRFAGNLLSRTRKES
ncbi:MAG: flagellar biosynthetic protein FliO [Deltaproteobacteria bacterium]|jgi:flagellar biosynthetic protein FliO